MRKPPGERSTSSRCLPSWLSPDLKKKYANSDALTMKMIRIIQYTFSTWKDKFLFNLLFWIPNSFCTFHDYARVGTPFLAFPDGLSLIFYHSDFWTTFFLWKTELPWNFSLWWNIFYLSGLLGNLWIALKNRVCPEFIELNTYIYLIIKNFEQLAHALKNRVCPEILHCIEISLSFRIFEELALALKTKFVMKFFAVFNIRFTFRMFEQLLLALKNRVCL